MKQLLGVQISIRKGNFNFHLSISGYLFEQLFSYDFGIKWKFILCMVCQTDQDCRNIEILTDFFHCYYLNMNISLDIKPPFLKLSTSVGNILMQRSMPQFFFIKALF